jgi:hypothetical protein
MAVFTRNKAENLGWGIKVGTADGLEDDDLASADKEDQHFMVRGGPMLFMVLAQVASVEGQGFLVNYGGDSEMTPSLVNKVSGETWAVPEPDPVVEPVRNVTVSALGEALATLPEGQLTKADLMAALATVGTAVE